MKKEEIKQLSDIMKSAISIELHVKDFESTRRFYISIGFEIIFDSPRNYLVLKKGKAILNFWGDGDAIQNNRTSENFLKNQKKDSTLR